MADDWIKIRSDLPDDPNVLVMADHLNIECRTVVGHLVVFWSWMDKHTTDGKLKRLTRSMIDTRVGVPGFAQALVEVNWLAGADGALFIPNFERHNSLSAKARALEAEAKRIRRQMAESGEMSDKPQPEKHKECPTTVGQKQQKKSDQRREEKNRELNISSSKIYNAFPQISALKGIDFSAWPELPSAETMAQWMKVRKTKRATNSQIAMDAVRGEIEMAGFFNVTADECIRYAVEKSWSGFTWQWITNELQQRGTLGTGLETVGVSIAYKYREALKQQPAQVPVSNLHHEEARA